MLLRLGPLLLVLILLPTCSGFQENDIQCQDPFDANNTVTVKSSLICDEIQNCFQGLDESGDICGNLLHVELQLQEAGSHFVTLEWQTEYYPTAIWGPDAEERRTAMFGPRTEADGCFLTWLSSAGSSTANIEACSYVLYTARELQPFTDYTFLLRPYTLSQQNTRGYKIGKASTVTVRTQFSDPQDLTAVVSGDGVVVVSWKARGYVERFEVEVLVPENKCHGCTEEYRILEATTVQGADVKGLRSYSVIFTRLWPEVEFRVKSCVDDVCKAHRGLRTRTMRPLEPIPSITRVAPQSDSSFDLEWEVLNDNEEAYEGVVVHYCEPSPGWCHETTTERTANSLTVGNLRANTTYNIRLHLRLTRPGKTSTLGKPSSGVVTTWPRNHLELEPAAKPVLSEPDAALYAWKFYGSSLQYVQFSLDGEQWQNCSESSNCTVTVLRQDPRLSSPITGTLRLWNLQPYTTYTFFVRGCNDNGCGVGLGVRHTTEVRASSPPRNLVVTSLGDGTSIVRWDPPLHPAGPLDGYKVSRECPGKGTRYMEVTATEAVVEDLPEGDNCSLSVLAYHYVGEDYTVLGERSYWRSLTWTLVEACAREIEKADPFAEANPLQEGQDYGGP